MRQRHGFAKGGQVERLHNIWRGIKKRCYSPRCEAYPRYGGRGILMCDEWLVGYVAFRTWSLAHGYDESLTIDRIDNNKGYSPDNCRWTTRKEQAINRESTRRITANGMTKTIAQWSEESGLTANLIYHRIKDLNWPPERAVSMRVRGRLLTCPHCNHAL